MTDVASSSNPHSTSHANASAHTIATSSQQQQPIARPGPSSRARGGRSQRGRGRGQARKREGAAEGGDTPSANGDATVTAASLAEAWDAPYDPVRDSFQPPTAPAGASVPRGGGPARARGGRGGAGRRGGAASASGSGTRGGRGGASTSAPNASTDAVNGNAMTSATNADFWDQPQQEQPRPPSPSSLPKPTPRGRDKDGQRVNARRKQFGGNLSNGNEAQQASASSATTAATTAETAPAMDPTAAEFSPTFCDEPVNAAATTANAATPAPAPAANPRRRRFGGELSAAATTTPSSTTTPPKPHPNKSKSSSGSGNTAPPPPAIDNRDMRSRLIAELNSGAYECCICYSGIPARQAVWSCSQCHTVLHLSCIKQWASTSVEAAEAQNAMQEDEAIRRRKGTWRCPGCQLAREEVPRVYRCWDGQVSDPVRPQHGGGGGKKARVPPHSCGRPCAKGKCEHGCSAGMCHPGPCPPCPVTLHHRCFCGEQHVAVRCSQLGGAASKGATNATNASAASGSSSASSASSASGISCGNPCNKFLPCGKHRCTQTCHPGACQPCEETNPERCYCGKHEEMVRCGTGERKICVLEGNSGEESPANEVWEGAWACNEVCGRTFDCGIHTCKRGCHPPTTSRPPCPFSPAAVATCPCGAEPRTDRTACTDPIPTCNNTCGKPFPCGHACRSKCHKGECPPCRVPVSAPCRCGESRPTLPCSERRRGDPASASDSSEELVLCDVVCRALRHCGRHECKRRCCPLAFQAKASKKASARTARPPTQAEMDVSDPARLHACPVPCNRPLSCGAPGHTCPLHCHRGACPPCLQACFEDVPCHCGRTVLEPPVPCGQRPVCRFPCARPPPPCGHPKAPHDCHDDDTSCPPCVYLATRRCDCGKNLVQNVPCSRQRVSCGAPCGALKPCGFHRCAATCHAGAPQSCGECTAVCGKPKRGCGHPCKERCHAPARCDESRPCDEVVTVSCPCGHLKQKARCGAAGGAVERGASPPLKCNDSCALAARNARLAEALGLDAGGGSSSRSGSAAAGPGSPAPPQYPSDLLLSYHTSPTFCTALESQLTSFIHSPRHALILPPANRAQRIFTHALAAVFGLQTESLDAEPNRSVQVRRTGEARVPRVLPSEVYAGAKREYDAGLGGGAGSLQAYVASLGAGASTASAGGAGAGVGTTPSRLVPLRSGGATGAAPAYNALLLEGLFGQDEASLRSLLTSTSSSTPIGGGAAPLRLVPFKARWISDESAVLFVESEAAARGSAWGAAAATPLTARLLAAKGDVLRTLRSAQALSLAGPGTRAGVLAVAYDAGSGRVLRREDRAAPLPQGGSGGGSAWTTVGNGAGSASANASGRNTPTHTQGSGSGAGTKLSGWAAVASAGTAGAAGIAGPVRSASPVTAVPAQTQTPAHAPAAPAPTAASGSAGTSANPRPHAIPVRAPGTTSAKDKDGEGQGKRTSSEQEERERERERREREETPESWDD